MSTSKKVLIFLVSFLFFIVGTFGGFVGFTIYEKSQLNSDEIEEIEIPGSGQGGDSGEGTTPGGGEVGPNDNTNPDSGGDNPGGGTTPDSGGDNSGGGDAETIISDDLKIHFLELGNGATGDCIYIRAGNTDIIVDGGSKTNSSRTIINYIDKLVPDKVVEYAIVTHADRDHIACFAGDGSNESLFDHYEFKTIIDFAKTNKTTEVYKKYVQKRDQEVLNGAKHYTAYECYTELNGGKKNYELGKGINLNILNSYYYTNKSSDENNYSVCFQIERGKDKYLFTGDLEKSGEKHLVELNNLEKVKFFKAGHHGSNTSSTDVLLDIIQPEICVVTCVAGSVEYTDNLDNTFPTQDFINRISKWTKKVYVPSRGFIDVKEVKPDGTINYKDVGYESMNGNIVISATSKGVEVNCSKTNTLLKDTAWFKEYRSCPANWAA